MARQIPDDAAEEARIRVWKKIHKVDVTRPETARAYLMQAAVTGIRDAVRKYLRQTRYERGNVDEMDQSRFKSKREEPEKYDYNDLLRRYIDYIEATGDFHGAHKAIGEELNVTTARASTMFHGSARQFIEELKKRG